MGYASRSDDLVGIVICVRTKRLTDLSSSRTSLNAATGQRKRMAFTVSAMSCKFNYQGLDTDRPQSTAPKQLTSSVNRQYVA